MLMAILINFASGFMIVFNTLYSPQYIKALFYHNVDFVLSIVIVQVQLNLVAG